MGMTFGADDEDAYFKRRDEIGDQFAQWLDTHGVPELDEPEDELEMPAIAPVRLPPEEERLAVVRATPVMRQVRALAEYCAAPGRKLTKKGNLGLADARHLVAALDTGDDPELGGVRKLQSSDQLPELSRLVGLAVEAGAVRLQQGRLVAVAHFAELDECAAYEKVALAAAAIGPSGSLNPLFGGLDAMAQMFTTALLAELLRHGSSGIEMDLVTELTGGFLDSVAPEMPDFMAEALPTLTNEHLGQLVDLGVLAVSGAEATPCDDCGSAHPEGGHLALTAAGVPIAVELLRQAEVEVPIRPEPADADVTSIVDLFAHLGEEEMRREVEEWLAAQPDRHAAVEALAAESLTAQRDTVTAMTGITLLDTLAADRAVDLLRPHQEGPHDGLVLQWLLNKDALDPESVDPDRLMAGVIDFLAVGLDTAGPEELVHAFSDGLPDDGVAVLDQIWRLDHPRLADVLDAIGREHPVKAVAKAARKALMKHKSRSSDTPQ